MKKTADDIFHIQNWTPELLIVANKIIADIHSVCPELEVLFMGAAALGIPDKNDIDLDILCTQADIPNHTNRLISVLGLPVESNSSWSVWSFVSQEYKIDAILSDPLTSHVPLQKKQFELLKSATKLLKKYQDLKISCDGMPYEEYKRLKTEFLDSLIS